MQSRSSVLKSSSGGETGLWLQHWNVVKYQPVLCSDVLGKLVEDRILLLPHYFSLKLSSKEPREKRFTFLQSRDDAPSQTGLGQVFILVNHQSSHNKTWVKVLAKFSRFSTYETMKITSGPHITWQPPAKGLAMVRSTSRGDGSIIIADLVVVLVPLERNRKGEWYPS